jgi:hypothetical protein
MGNETNSWRSEQVHLLRPFLSKLQSWLKKESSQEVIFLPWSSAKMTG